MGWIGLLRDEECVVDVFVLVCKTAIGKVLDLPKEDVRAG